MNEIWKLCDIPHKSILYSIFQNQFLGRSSQIHEKSKKTKNTVSVGFFKDRNSTEANMKVQLVNSKKNPNSEYVVQPNLKEITFALKRNGNSKNMDLYVLLYLDFTQM